MKRNMRGWGCGDICNGVRGIFKTHQKMRSAPTLNTGVVGRCRGECDRLRWMELVNRFSIMMTRQMAKKAG